MDRIVAIDLGTSHITGIVGEKNSDGTFSIIACETEESSSCIRRGNISNIDLTASHINSIIRKLETKLSGGYIEKIYVGVGGQSLKTIDHTEIREIADGSLVTEDDIRILEEQCRRYVPDLLDVLDIVSPTFYIDGRIEPNPVGVSCKHLEVRYKLVVGRPSIRRDINRTVEEFVHNKIAGIIVSPLALADAMLSKEEKELGCALVDFGGGVTTLSVYKNGALLDMCVIPLGGMLITRDIISLQLTASIAEMLKQKYGQAIWQKEKDETIPINIEGLDKEISENDLNAVIEARAMEIVENVAAALNKIIDAKNLGAGIVLAGCASSLQKIDELVREKCKTKVRFSAIQQNFLNGFDDMSGNPTYMSAISIMLKGTEPCVSVLEQAQSEPPKTEPDDVKPPTTGTGTGRGTKKKWTQRIGDIFSDV